LAGTYLHERVRAGDTLDVSAPRGSFILQPGERPLALLSAGIGATPVLAMLHALASTRSGREVLWLHAARDGAHHPFAAEARGPVQALARARSYVCYSHPLASDRVGMNFDAAGHLDEGGGARARAHEGLLPALEAQQLLYATEDALVVSSLSRCLVDISLFKALGGNWKDVALPVR
jgi:ferredoxin-NADP reductase